MLVKAKRLSVAIAVVLGLMAAANSAMAQKVLRVVPYADLKTLDPYFTTTPIVQAHGYLVYDTLFAMDSKLNPKPQMVESYEISSDGLRFSFTLRSGLKFTDGSPVLAKDVVPSILRWSARSTPGATLKPYFVSVAATGPTSVLITLKEPVAGQVANLMASVDSPVFVMREKEALTEATRHIDEIVGSGPFIFLKDQWVPGSKAIYLKNPEYQPRTDSPDGAAGGKIVKVDRLEWLYLPDANSSAQALINGEVDIIINPSPDVLPLLRANSSVTVNILDDLGYEAIVRPNHLIPPFDNPKMRLALLYLAGDQRDYLAAATSSKEDQKQCAAVFMCGSPLETNAGVGPWLTNDDKTNLEIAKKLIREAGYNGQRIVLMDPVDHAAIHALTLVTAQKLRLAGVNVDVQSQDFSTIVTRRQTKVSPEENRGGWHILHSTIVSGAASEPLTAVAAASNCERAWPGWPCDKELENIRVSFFHAANLEERKALARKYQELFYAGSLPYIPVGQVLVPTAYRNNISGVLKSPRLLFWNIEKK